MKINLQIDRIVLRDLSLGLQQRAQLQTALQSELQRILLKNGAGPGLQGDKRVRSTAPQTIMMTDNGNAGQLGSQLAWGIFRGINR